MSFRRVFVISWSVCSTLVAAWLIVIGWRGDAPQLAEPNAWLAFMLALFLSAVFAVIPAALLSAAIWGARTRDKRHSLVENVTRRSQRYGSRSRDQDP